ncbi:hypothetical protein LIER_42353 [Lithospermum erythrorhizon]|uniref:Uncharacterized protein n=1 Tax=Lithospermum erythrorhizon TaxID=34254 RepID=A0AAV3RNY1_LITER
MENSVNSTNNNILMIASSSKEKRVDNDHNSPEESSWTFYIQDFLCEDDNNSLSSYSCYEMSDSLLSDAAAPAVKDPNYQKDGGLNVNYETSKRKTKRTIFRKQIVTHGAAMDEDLEDTASSPVNSPKVSYMNNFEIKQKELPNVYQEEVGRKSSSSRDEVGGDITELKKRGLCLVPLSNVANYFSY